MTVLYGFVRLPEGTKNHQNLQSLGQSPGFWRLDASNSNNVSAWWATACANGMRDNPAWKRPKRIRANACQAMLCDPNDLWKNRKRGQDFKMQAVDTDNTDSLTQWQKNEYAPKSQDETPKIGFWKWIFPLDVAILRFALNPQPCDRWNPALKNHGSQGLEEPSLGGI